MSICARVTFIVAVIVLCSQQALAQSTAAVEVVVETDTTLTMRFTDATAAQETITFTRATANDYWEANHPSGWSKGVVFGNSQPVYASVTAQRSLGVTPQEAVRTFSTEIAQSSFSDITIFKINDLVDDIVIALSQEGRIVELWYAGTLVDMVLAGQGMTACERVKYWCCADKFIENPDGDPETDDGTLVPYPYIPACLTLTSDDEEAPCPGFKDEACECLDDSCNACTPLNNPDVCQGDVLQKSMDSCIHYVDEGCDDPPDEPEPPQADPEEEAIRELLRELLERLQVVIDSIS